MARSRSSCVSSVVVFALGIVSGSVITIAVDLQHDENVRMDVWRQAITHGVVCPQCCDTAERYENILDLPNGKD